MPMVMALAVVIVRIPIIRFRSNRGRQSNVTTAKLKKNWHLDGNPGAFFLPLYPSYVIF